MASVVLDPVKVVHRPRRYSLSNQPPNPSSEPQPQPQPPQRRRRSLPDIREAREADSLSSQLGRQPDTDSLTIPDFQQFRSSSHGDQDGRTRRGSQMRHRKGFEEQLLPEVEQTGGLSIMGQSSGAGITHVTGKFTQPRRPSMDRPSSARPASARGDIHVSRASHEIRPALGDFAARRQSGAAADRSALDTLRQPLPPLARPKPPEQLSSALIEPETGDISKPISQELSVSARMSPKDGPSSLESTASLRSLEGTLEKLEEDNKRVNKKMSLLKTACFAVQAFKDTICSPRNQAAVSGNQEDSSLRHRLLAEGDNDDKVGNSSGKEPTEVGHDTAQADVSPRSKSLRSAAKTASEQLHNGAQGSAAADAADTGGASATTASGGENEDGSEQARYGLGDTVEFLISGSATDGKWVRCKVVGIGDTPTSYNVQVIEGQDRGGEVADDPGDEANFGTTGDTLGLRTNVAETRLRPVQEAEDDLMSTLPSTEAAAAQSRVTPASELRAPPPTEEASDWKNASSKSGKCRASSRESSVNGRATAEDDLDEDDLLDQFMEDLFVEFSGTKDNKGRPLMNNMGVRRFFMAFATGRHNKVIAKADVSYEAEIERQKDLNFRFDLSKAEAKRGLCFKSFCTLLEQVYPKGQSRTIMRQRFTQYAGDAKAMEQDVE